MGCKLPWQRHLSQIQLLKKHTTKSERTKVPNTLFLAMLTKTNCALMLLVEILLKEFLNSVILKFNTVTSKSTTKTLMELTENDSFSSVGSDLTEISSTKLLSLKKQNESTSKLCLLV